jgi:hypothetical protein
MPLFYLEPKDDDISDPRWATTTLKEGCWVAAPTEAVARLIVQQATIKLLDLQPDELLYSPWLDEQLTDCRPDSSALAIPHGSIVTVSGKTIP